MKKITSIVALASMTLLSSCTVALNRANWDSWIGRDWHEFNEATSARNCYANGNTVTCPKALGDLHWYVDGSGIIQSWDYIHRD